MDTLPHNPSHDVDDVIEKLGLVIRDLQTKLEERESLGFERDRRYEERFKAQETAVVTALAGQGVQTSAAFAAAEKAVAAALSAQKEITNAAFASSEKAILRADLANEKRFDNVNEFRQTLSDQTANFVPRMELDARFITIERAIETVSKVQSGSIGRSTGMDSAWGYLIGAFGVLIAIASIIVTLVRR